MWDLEGVVVAGGWWSDSGGWWLVAGGDPSDSHCPAGGSAESISACLSDAMQPACGGADGALAGWQGMGIGWGGVCCQMSTGSTV